jgi:integrase
MGNPKKRGRLYYANTWAGGTRLRRCLNTSNYQEALGRQRELVQKALEGKIQNSPAQKNWSSMLLEEALDLLLEQRKRDGKAEGTLRLNRERSVPLKRLLGAVRVGKIEAETIAEYQRRRLDEGVSGRTINLEVSLLRLVLKKARRWARLEEDIENLPVNRDVIAAVLPADRKRHLFEVAMSKPEWSRAFYCAIVAVNTTARKIEILRTRYRDVDLARGIWTIPKSKTKGGVREIPLNPEAQTAFARMMQAGEMLGGGDPEHFIFCACENKQFDFTRPQNSVRTAWRKLTAAAGLKGFRLHDLRHQAITELAESGAPDSVIQSIAGHLSKKMQDHYTHVRLQAKEKAVSALGGTGILDRSEDVVSSVQ